MRENAFEFTDAIGISSRAFVPLDQGRDTRNGREGAVNENDSGAGSINVAAAVITTLSRSDQRLKDFRVIKSENAGNGVCLPGLGRPGSGGTFDILSGLSTVTHKKTTHF